MYFPGRTSWQCCFESSPHWQRCPKVRQKLPLFHTIKFGEAQKHNVHVSVMLYFILVFSFKISAFCMNSSRIYFCCFRYVWEHLDIGYVQGMCDLVAPLLVIFDDGKLKIDSAVYFVIRLGTRQWSLLRSGCLFLKDSKEWCCTFWRQTSKSWGI